MKEQSYAIEITETLQQTILIKAHSEEEAIAIVRKAYREEEIYLPPEDIVKLDIECIGSDPLPDECPHCHAKNIEGRPFMSNGGLCVECSEPIFYEG